jgi:hypothetical protein
MPKPKIKFSPLVREEKISKLNQLTKNSLNECKLWVKGKPERFFFKASYFNEEKFLLSIQPQEEYKLSDGEYCFNFELNGLNYFIESNVKRYLNDNTYTIDCEQNLFKGERRGSFRLLTYPTYKVKAYLKLDEKETQEGNLLEFKTKMSRTGLFKNFLELIDKEEKSKRGNGFISFRVQDLSATGVCVIVGKMESELFKVGMEIPRIEIKFEKESIMIPGGEVVYINEYTQEERNNLDVYKAGIRYKFIDLNTEQKITQKIHSILTKLDSGKDFEDFIS